VSLQKATIYRFGVFELDPRAGELRKNGVKLKLQEQPHQVLLKLLEHPGNRKPGRVAIHSLARGHFC
jgi:DNA-binding winged helix-turn-helix (wHTH) protein